MNPPPPPFGPWMKIFATRPGGAPAVHFWYASARARLSALGTPVNEISTATSRVGSDAQTSPAGVVVGVVSVVDVDGVDGVVGVVEAAGAMRARASSAFI